MGTVAAKKVGQRFPGSKNVSVKVKATNEETLDESEFDRRRNRLMSMATDHEERAKKTTNPIKKNHHRKMADDIRSQIVALRSESTLGEETVPLVEEDDGKTTVVSKGKESGTRWEMRTRLAGEPGEYSSIIKTHQDGRHLQNKWGGYNVYKVGKTPYIKKHFDKLALKEESLDEAKPDFHYQEWPGQKPKKAFNASKYLENNAKRMADIKKKEGIKEGALETIKGAIRREKSKSHPILQTRGDYAHEKAGDSYAAGKQRMGDKYAAFADKERKKRGMGGTVKEETLDEANRLKYDASAKQWYHSANSGFTWKRVTSDEAKKAYPGKHKDITTEHGLKEAALDESYKSSDGDELGVGHHVGFKHGHEQYGKVHALLPNGYLHLKVWNGDTGQAEDKHIPARQCWKESLDIRDRQRQAGTAAGRRDGGDGQPPAAGGDSGHRHFNANVGRDPG
jgi:hypothetical protein